METRDPSKPDRRRYRLRRAALAVLGAVVPLSLLSLVVTAAPAPAGADTGPTWYVNAATGSDYNNCTSPSTACQSLAGALEFANQSYDGGTIMVAPGHYFVQNYVQEPITIEGTGSSPGDVVFDESLDGSEPDAPVLFTQNSLGGDGPFITISDVTITGSNDSGIYNYGADLTLNNDVITKNGSRDSSSDLSQYTTQGVGGGIDNFGELTLNNTVVSNNTANYGGGGIFNTNSASGAIPGSGNLTLNHSTVSGNSGGPGAGIDNEGGKLVVNASTVSGNSTASWEALGGGIEVDSGSLQLVNSTVADNAATLWGGGIDFDHASGTLVNDTISANSATGSPSENPNIYGGGIALSNTFGPSAVSLQNTILAGNTAPANADCYGTLTDHGNNILGDNQGCSGFPTGTGNGTDFVGTATNPVNPGLGQLANNGGNTLTMAIGEQSPAFGAGNAAACQGAAGGVDERGAGRQAATRGVCDIGAYDTTLLAPPVVGQLNALSLNDQISVTWVAPAGYLPSIAYYVVTCNPSCGNQYTPTNSGQTYLDVTGLTVGQTYTFQVQAVSNVGGAGAVSPPSNAAGYAVPPGEPTNVVATVNGTTVTISWNPPANDNGAGITEYDVMCPLADVWVNAPDGTPTYCTWYNPAARPGVFGPLATTVNLYNLPRGQTIQFAVLAGNSVGAGYEAYANPITVPQLPGTPTIAVTPQSLTGSGNVTSNTEPTFQGTADAGSTVTIASGTNTVGTATAGATGQWTFTPSSPLPDAISAFTASVTDGAGTSTSLPLNLEIDASTPTAPTVTATAGQGSALVSWTASTDDDAPINGYVVTASPGGAQQSVGAGQLTASFNGLQDGTPYTFTVQASNNAGTKGAIGTSNAVTPLGVPSAPQGVSATAGPEKITATWYAPATTNGSPVTGYTVTATPLGGGTPSTGTFGATATFGTLSGLSDGTDYVVTVTATNAVGTGPSGSAADNPVLTPQVPTAPTGAGGFAGVASVTLSWSAPASNGGLAISGYRVTPSPACKKCTGLTPTGTTTQITGLKNGTRYTFTVQALNQIGAGPASSPTGALTPSANAPHFTSKATGTAEAAAGATFKVKVAGKPTPTVSVPAGELPSWAALSLKRGQPVLTVVPPTGTSGTFSWTYTAVNTAGEATQVFTLTVNP